MRGRRGGWMSSMSCCCQRYPSQFTITSAHNLQPRLRAPGRGLARGPGPPTTRTAHTPIWHHFPQKAHPIPARAHPYLEESDSCPLGPALWHSNFNPAPCDSSHVAPPYNTPWAPRPHPCHVCSVARGTPRNVDGGYGAGHGYGTRGDRVMSVLRRRRQRNIFRKDRHGWFSGHMCKAIIFQI